MTRLATHPRRGLPTWANHIAFEGGAAGAGGGGGGNPPADAPPKADDAPKDSDKPPAQGADESDWKAWARKWEDRAKENSKAAEELKTVKGQLEKLAPLAQLAEALGAKSTEDPNEVKQVADRVTNFEKQLADERAARYRAEVANEKKLTADQATWLTGSTKEEMATSADALLAAFPQQEQPKNPMVISKSGTGDPTPQGGSVSKGRDMYRAEREKHTPAVQLQNT